MENNNHVPAQPEQKKNPWQKFNPSIKEMTDKNPNYTILGLWWSQTWRIWILSMIVWIVFAILVGIFGFALGR